MPRYIRPVLAIDAGSRLIGWCSYAGERSFTAGVEDVTKAGCSRDRLLVAGEWFSGLVQSREIERSEPLVVIEKSDPCVGSFSRGTNPTTTDLLAGVSWIFAWVAWSNGLHWVFADSRHVKDYFVHKRNADKREVYAELERLGMELPRGPKGAYKQDACDAIALARLVHEEIQVANKEGQNEIERLAWLYGKQEVRE